MNAKERRERPIEHRNAELHNRVEWARQTLFGLKNLGEEVDPGGVCESKTNELRAIDLINIETLKDDLAEERRAFVLAKRRKDKWASPSGLGGWLCPNSPTGICEYGNYYQDQDQCSYCGDPSERK